MLKKTGPKKETIVLHAGHRKDETTNAVAVPIYQSTSYQFNDTEHAANLFALKEFGNIYSRIMNPTCAVLEERVAKLEGGAASLAVSSGQAASMMSIQNIAHAGVNVQLTPYLNRKKIDYRMKNRLPYESSDHLWVH